jgi:hypothetical protein
LNMQLCNNKVSVFSMNWYLSLFSI